MQMLRHIDFLRYFSFKKQMEEHKEWLMAKYGNISSSLSELFHLGHKDHVLNAFLQCIDQIWEDLRNNTESYIEKVNAGRPLADMVRSYIHWVIFVSLLGWYYNLFFLRGGAVRMGFVFCFLHSFPCPHVCNILRYSSLES